MKPRRLFSSLLLICLTALPCLAGPGHDHGTTPTNFDSNTIDEAAAIAAVSKAVAAIIAQNVELEGALLDPEWNTLPQSSKTVKTYHLGYFLVTFRSKKLKKSLYSLVSKFGEIREMNHTGVFEEFSE